MMRARIVKISGSAFPENKDGTFPEATWEVELAVIGLEEYVTKAVVDRAFRDGVEFRVVPQ